MELIKAIFMGIIQGVTEFLPVSSSGHLAIFKYIFNMQDVSATFDVMLHVGTLAAVFVVYWKDIWKLICEGFSFLGDVFHNLSVFFKRNIARENVEYRRIIRSSYRKFTLLIIVSTIPTGIIGLAVKKSGLNDLMSSALIYPGICLLITGCVLMICDTFEEGYKTPKKTTFVDSIIIGIVQGIATLPGISRSGSTITAARACGLKKSFAVKYSFIMSIPAILAAGILDVKDIVEENPQSSEIVCYVVGTIVAAVVGYICIKTMLIIVRGKKFKYFAYYCFVAGSVSIVYYISKLIVYQIK